MVRAKKTRVVRQALAFSPALSALAIWALGSALVLAHVLAAQDFVMEEVRRHRLVPSLVGILFRFAVPYLVLGTACAWLARGLIRLGSRTPGAPGLADAALGNAFLIAALAGSTVLGMVERPALFAGLFYLQGGWRGALQLGLERVISPPALVRLALVSAVLLAAAAAAGWWRHARRSRRPAAVVVLVLAAWAGGALVVDSGWDFGWGSWRRAGAATGSAHRPSVLLLLVDSLRHDALDPDSPYGAATPRLRMLARASARFADMRTPLARTYPALATLFTSRHPVQHGVRTTYPDEPSRRIRGFALPRALRARGFTTVAVGGYCATALRELDLGFEVQRTPRSETGLITALAALRGHPLMPIWARTPWARRVWPEVRATIEGSSPGEVVGEAVSAWRAARRPFFMTVFLDNPHLPYVPVWPESSSAGPYAGPNRYSVSAGNLVERVREGESATLMREQAAERANARRLYSASVRSADRAAGALLDALDRDGLGRDTIVLVLGDHGENLLDAGGPLAHGESAERDRSTSIPCLLRWTGRIRPQTVPDAVTVADLAPTLLDLLDLPVPGAIEGASLRRRLHGGPPLADRAALFETGEWFFARQAVDRTDPSGRGLAYPAFVEGLFAMEPGAPPHIVVAPAHRRALYRAKQRRLEQGAWALTYLPRTTGAAFHLFRRDLDPWLTRDLGAVHPERKRQMVALFYREAARLGERDLLPPEPEQAGRTPGDTPEER